MGTESRQPEPPELHLPGDRDDGDGLVVVGASAGGIDALGTLLAGLPQPFPAPIVVAQHLDPRRESHLPDILAPRSALPVRLVQHQLPLEPGVVYLVPSDRNVEITDHHVAVSAGSGKRAPMPSIDRLLSSAARAYGERLIGVILTGLGSDGALGARQVKALGGTVIVQDPKTADFPAMPLALPTGLVDIFAQLESMGRLLADLLTGAYPLRRADEERQLSTFLEQVREQSGVDFGAYKRPTILRRLQRRMAATNTSRLRDYVRHVQDHPEEYERLVSSFLIKVTEFFRDPDLFAYLRDHILPDVIRDARRSGNELRLWSAGCATGEEAYSLAMLVAEALGDELPRWTVRIFATDLDGEAILYARRGIYPVAALESVPRDLVDRYFTRVDSGFQVSKAIRLMTVFGQHDLAQGSPFPRIDVALCRNVLIYFTSELQKRALQLFAFSLRDGAYLVLGNAETTTPLSSNFAIEEPRLKVYRRQGERLLIPAPRSRDAPAPPPLPVRLSANRRAVQLDALSGAGQEARLPSTAERADVLLLTLPFGVVLIDEHYDIQFLNNAARAMFGIHGPAIGQDFVHLVRAVPSTTIRGAIDQALRGEDSVVTHGVSAREAPDGRQRTLEVHVQRYRSSRSERPAASIVVRDITQTQDGIDRIVQERDRERSEREQLLIQLQRVVETNQQLLSDNNDLTLANASLRSANEELLIANEEAQAATEEVETLNEELQATNEELETLNEELQATVEELNTTTDDMAARTAELQESTAALEVQQRAAEAARAQLSAVIASLRDGVIVVDSARNVVLQNDAYLRLLGEPSLLLEDEKGRQVPSEAALRERASRGEAFNEQYRTRDEAGASRWFEVIGQPFSDGDRSGGILVVRDITERSLRRMQTEFVAIVAHELRTPLTALRGYLQLLDRQLDGGAAARYASLALVQARRLQSLIGDLFDTARLDAGKLSYEFSSIDLAQTVAEAVDVGGTLSDRHRIESSIEPGPLPIRGDPGRIQQVVLNVIANAVTHAPNSETIEVRVGRDQDTGVVWIVDHGPGIALADLPVLFSRYRQGTTTPRTGLGLGLYISREIVTAHQGTIEATATPGGGTTITIRLPLITGAPAASSADRARASPVRRGRQGGRSVGA